ncbi:MAG: CapA family protein [Deltaproteobacteria bacterium]|nr:CapA family protein [Deltaproteobacteria bacterium]
MNVGRRETGRLFFAGDTYLPRAFPSTIDGVGGLVFNLEHPITRRTAPATGKVVLKADAEHFIRTFGGGPLAACLANNHIMDYGPEGLEDTIAALDALGVGYFGAGTRDDNCGNPIILDMGGIRVALSGYVCPTTHPVFAEGARPGVAPIDAAAITRDTALARKAGADRVVVCLHWGAEEVFLPSPGDAAPERGS